MVCDHVDCHLRHLVEECLVQYFDPCENIRVTALPALANLERIAVDECEVHRSGLAKGNL